MQQRTGDNLKRLCGALLLAAATATALSAQGRQGPGPTKGRLLINYPGFDSVRVEVRVGEAADCNRNPRAGLRYLKRGRTWSIHTDQTICWRREESPGRQFTGLWTAWKKRKIPPGRSERAE